MEVRVSPGVGLRGGLPLHIYESRVLLLMSSTVTAFLPEDRKFFEFHPGQS